MGIKMKEFYKTLLNPQGKFGIWGIAALICIGIALMVLPGLFLGEEEQLGLGEEMDGVYERETSNVAGSSASLLSMEETLAKQAQSILSQVDGVGVVAVSVTLATGAEHDLACNGTSRKSVIEEKDSGGGTRITTESDEQMEYVLTQGRGEPLILKEKAPEIKGVLVVAEGAKDVQIKIQLSRAVQSLFDLPAHRVMILPKESR
jgi:stage III sporulation protein AG